jgi:hypothetical protein
VACWTTTRRAKWSSWSRDGSSFTCSILGCVVQAARPGRAGAGAGPPPGQERVSRWRTPGPHFSFAAAMHHWHSGLPPRLYLRGCAGSSRRGRPGRRSRPTRTSRARWTGEGASRWSGDIPAAH